MLRREVCRSASFTLDVVVLKPHISGRGGARGAPARGGRARGRGG